MTDTGTTQTDQKKGISRILLLLFASGWAANHFTALIPTLQAGGQYPPGSLEIAFGVYALGLLPSLLSGGALADRFQPRPLTIIGALTAAAGNLGILLWPGPAGTTVSRFLIGIGVGLAISAGNAWADRARPNGGATLAGMILTAGFAAGPLIGGLVSVLVPGNLSVSAPIATTVALSCIAALLVATMRAATASAGTTAPDSETASAVACVSVGPVLRRALPMALWVFSSIVVPMIVLADRMPATFSGPVPAGLLAFAALGTGALTQILARRRSWGGRSGTAGAVFAAAGFALAAAFGSPATPFFAFICAILFGIAYGLCLRAGLMDIEQLAPAGRRGLVGGIYYITTYLGFGLPYLLTVIEPTTGAHLPLAVVAVLAAATAVLRARQLRAPSSPASAR